MGVKISALPTATQAEAASGLIPVVTDPNGDGNLVTKHITASSIGGGGANVNTSSSPPSNPSNGDLWFDEGNAELYIYNSSINGWIQTNGGGGGGSSGEVTGAGIARAVLRITAVNSSNTLGADLVLDGSFNVASISTATSADGRTYTVNFQNPVPNPIPIISLAHKNGTFSGAAPLSGTTSDGINVLNENQMQFEISQHSSTGRYTPVEVFGVVY